jgi:hypothetical protein
MARKILTALLLAGTIVGWSHSAGAAAFFGWQVTNVSSDDVLMVRAFPDAASRILVGYPDGTPLSLTGRCTGGVDLNAVSGLPAAAQAGAVRDHWCEVWVDPHASGNWQSGWVSGRYIRPL